MHYGWRRRSDIPRRPYWAALIMPLIAVAVILLGVTWEVTRADIEDPGPESIASLSQAAAQEPDNSTEGLLAASRTEAANLRQELAEVNLQLQQSNAALIAANEKVQTLQGELAAATQKLAEAKTDRDEALRVAG
jgi:septal ring factor EnvC (AmiA/AmiB activator)